MHHIFPFDSIEAIQSLFILPMIRIIVFFLLFLMTSCHHQTGQKELVLTNIQMTDRNGFHETVSTPDRLSTYVKTDFLSPQPYEKVTRIFKKNEKGQTPSVITAYHQNGNIAEYLELINGRACGWYRSWSEKGHVVLEGKVVEGVGDFSEDAKKTWVFDGTCRAWNEKQKLTAEIPYLKGKIHGDALYYASTGALYRKVPYYFDRIEGDVLYFNENHEIIGREEYRNHVKHGISFSRTTKEHPQYDEIYSEGLLLEGKYYDFQGLPIAKIVEGNGLKPVYRHGILHKMLEYKDGVPEGKVQIYSEKGYLTSTYQIKNGMKHGEEWIYYPPNSDQNFSNLTPKMVLNWYEDALHGIVKTWYYDGALESEKEMYNNEKHGVSCVWYDDGNLMMIEEYEHGKLCKGTYMKKGEETPVSKVEQGTGLVTLFDKDGYLKMRVEYEKGKPVEEK